MLVVWDEMFAEDIDALLGAPVVAGKTLTVYDLCGHRADGNIPAPDWDWPKDVGTGRDRVG